jgi:hypothetical protein
MGSQRHTGAFVAGSVIGGMVGAAVALWKTPKSGSELRASLSGGSRQGAVTYTTASGETPERRFASPVLGFVEKATAPIVGVDLGKLAKDDPTSYSAPVRGSSADARPPVLERVDERVDVTAPLKTVEQASPADFEAQAPAEEVTHDPVEGSTAHAASTEELVSPEPEHIHETEERAGDLPNRT